MSEMFEMFDFDEMKYVEKDLFDEFNNDIRDIDLEIMEEELVRFADNIVSDERRIA